MLRKMTIGLVVSLFVGMLGTAIAGSGNAARLFENSAHACDTADGC